MSLVLYRKYRPKLFSEIIGQEHIVKTLTNAISSGMISHAYFFSGPRGTGKTTMARLFAKAINCENRNPGESEPCNKCSSCLEINDGRSIDLIEIDAASSGGIDQIRELREGIKFVPTKSKYKVFILDEAHQLSKEAANAILKTLEEPPAHAIFILATTEAHKMIPTIISRCQHFDFWKLTLQQIIDKLDYVAKKEGVKIEKDAVKLIAAAGGGSIRDSESMLDQVFAFGGNGKTEIKAQDIKELFGIVDVALVFKFIGFLAEKDASGALNFLNETTDKGTDLQEFVKSIINYLRQILISKINPTLITSSTSGITKEEEEKLQKLSEQFKGIELQKILNLFLEAENKMKYSPIPQLPIELAVIEVAERANNQ